MKKLFVANWKSNKTESEVKRWLSEFKLRSTQDREVVIAPPFPFLPMVSAAGLTVAVQDLSPFPAGSYTGAVGVRNLQGLGVKYALVGHSERRRYFKESHQDVANKIEQAVSVGITPIVCVDTDYLAAQARVIGVELLSKCVVAYEPLSAIGTGENASIDEVAEVILRVKKVFGNVLVLYGGSVGLSNVDQYLAIASGVLVGGASLNAQIFAQLIHRA